MKAGRETDSTNGAQNNQPEARELLALHLLPALPASQFARALQRYGGARAILGQSAQTLIASGMDAATVHQVLQVSDKPDADLVSAIEEGMQWLEQPGNHLISMTDGRFPRLLREIPDCPALLYVSGTVSVLNRPALAVVGSRNSTAYGREMAFRLSAELAHKGMVICSGLATGIDTQAHIAAVSTNKPTIAVMGNGLANMYPPRNKELARRIVDADIGGALISELPLSAEPMPSHFPRRNRIISGLSLGVCVVEANLRSGSLITARLALEQNREVFAVPGSVNSQRSRGCHHLLRQGAVLVESVDDIVEQLESLFYGQLELMGLNTREDQPVSLQHNPGATLATRADLGDLLQKMGQDAVSVDTLVRRTGLSVAALSQKLLELELAGVISKTAGCWQRLNR
jgi:DNA processing protein